MRYEDIKAMNWSSLRHMATSARAFLAAQAAPPKDSPAMLLGRATHCATLEPDEFDERYLVAPESLDRRTKAGKAWAAEHEDDDREVLTYDQAQQVEAMKTAVLCHTEASRLLVGTDREVTIEWQAMGVDCKGRADALALDRLVDLKTCRSLRRFAYDAADRLYHAQMAWYLDGGIAAGVLSPNAEVFIIAVESAEPHDVGVFRLPDYVLQVGRDLYRRYLSEWLVCEHSGEWPGAYPEVVTLELPRWADPGFEEE